jgi:glucose-6-phosphate 1-dehydrogenase
MNQVQADALVFFGASGDLAYKKIFPALQALVKRGNLDIPVIGVAKAGWTLDQLKARARDSVERYGGLDSEAFGRLSGLMDYIDGDYADAASFQELRRKLADAKRPMHYLAIPPSLFETVIHQLVDSGCAEGARIVVERPIVRENSIQ